MLLTTGALKRIMNENLYANVTLNLSIDYYTQNDTASYNLQFNKNTLTIIVYVVLFCIAAIGNLTVVVSLLKSRYRKSRISLMILHLAIADSMVTFIMIPLEIGWRVTVQWVAGNAACKAFLLLRAFGLYLSSNVLICVSLDRYFAVLHPLRVNDARRRGKTMLICAWSVSLVCSAPQSIVFHVSPHPEYPTFLQCVSFGFFTTTSQEIAYNLFCLMGLYFVPLLVIIIAYTKILWEIFKKSKETNNETYQTSKGRMLLRRSDISNIERARSRTLKMTITIVGVFILCWTPYVVMTLWYMFDRESAAKVSSWLQDLFFLMAVSNSCMNPLVYGSYALNLRKECWASCCCCNMNKSHINLACRENVLSSAAGQGNNGLTQRINKYFNTLKKVGSGATRSTAIAPGMNIARFPISTTKKSISKFQTVKHLERPSSVGHIAFLSEPLNERTCRTSFHSDPCPYNNDNEHSVYKRNNFDKVEDII